jgi:hypothetical protein
LSAACKLLDDLAVIGATIEPLGDRLILRAGATAIPAALIVRIQQAKAELLDALAAAPVCHGWTTKDWEAFYGERAGILEFDCGLARPKAEMQAFEACIVEWLNQNPVPSQPGRCAWCGEREIKTAVVLPFGTEPGACTWLHGECWRPWQDSRRAQAVKALSRMGGLADEAVRLLT